MMLFSRSKITKLIFLITLFFSVASSSIFQKGTRNPATPLVSIDVYDEDNVLVKMLKSIEEYVFKAGVLAKNSAVNSVIFNANQLGISFGLDHGLISQVIFWIDREVIANPFRASKDDVYLAVDSLNIGFRLGAGIVATGDVALVKRYKAIYPVKEKREAFYRPFYPLTIFHPNNHHSDYWPKDLIIIHDNYLEGRGRLKLNDIFIMNPVNIEFTGSRVYIDRAIILKNHDGGIDVHNDYNSENKFAMDLSLKLLINIPLFNTNMGVGDISRKSYHFPFNDHAKMESKVSTDFISFLTIKKMQRRSADYYLLPEKVSSDFKRKFSNFSFFNLFNYDNHERTDFIKTINGDSSKIHFQALSQTSNQWKSPLNLSDTRQSLSSLFVAITDESKTQVKDPMVYLDILDFVSKSKKSELKKNYIDKISELAGDPLFFNLSLLDDSTHINNIDSLLVDVRLEYYQESINKILNLTMKDLDKTISKSLDMTESNWRNFRLTARSSLNSDRNYRQIRSSNHAYYVAIANQQNAFIKSMARIKKEKIPTKKMEEFNKTLRRALFKGQGGYSFAILSAVNKHLASNDYYLNANINLGKLDDNLTINIQNKLGTARATEYKVHSFDTDLSYYYYQTLKKY